MIVWNEFVNAQDQAFGKKVIDQWLRTLKVLHFDARNLYLEATSPFQATWFEEHVRPLAEKQLLNENKKPIRIHLSVTELPKKPKKKQPHFSSSFQLQLKPDECSPEATFSTFIPEDSHLLALDTLQTPRNLNPVYLYGPKGCGKSHLLMATAKHLTTLGKKNFFVNAETFTDHVVKAMRSGSMNLFRETYRHIDALLIDDIHRLARRMATQEELFHTFNALHQSGRTVFIAANQHPSKLEAIESRLTSRFEWGIVLHVPPLSKASLEQLLVKRQAHLNVVLPEEVVHFLLDTFGEAKPLLQALHTLILRAHMERRLLCDLTPLLAKKDLKELLLEPTTLPHNIDSIVTSVAEAHGISVEDLKGKSQTPSCVRPRQIAMHLCRKHLKLSYAEIGRYFSRDHTTVISSIKKVSK